MSPAQGSKKTAYTVSNYSTGDWKDQLVSVSEYTVADGAATLSSTKTVAYDASGNPTSYKGNTLTWNGRQLAGYGPYFSFDYDENGIRTSKTVGSTTTEYYYNGSLLMGMTYGSNIFLFSYDASGSVVSVNFNGTEYYYLKNAQSDIVGIVDGSGNIVVEYTYDSWGKPLPITQPTVATLAGLNPFRYRGYIYDNETGLYYLQSRYYDPATGRFLNADNLISEIGGTILGNNKFSYCFNNPICYVDDNGNWPVLLLVVIAVIVLPTTINGIINIENEQRIENEIQDSYTPEDAMNEINDILENHAGEDNKVPSMTYGDKGVEINYSYNVDSRYDRQKICMILSRTEGVTDRRYGDLSAEWLFHNLAYDLHIERGSAENANLDYVKDERWIVQASTDVLEGLQWI